MLLLALQGIWLTNSYERAYFDLRRETNGIFRTTVMALRDTFLMSNIKKVSLDTTISEKTYSVRHRVNVDTLSSAMASREDRVSQIQIWISSERQTDSLPALLRPLASRVQEGKVGSGNFVFRLGSDSLSVDSIEVSFKKNLAEVDLALPFEVRHTSMPPPIALGNGRMMRTQQMESLDKFEDRVFSNQLFSDWVRFDPIHQYSVMLSGFRFVLIKQILPQILFSIFLTLLTTGAFIIMYRSLRSQQRLMDLKNDFISNITHELKTPVTTVGVALEAIKNFKGQNNPELTTEYLTIAQNELNRLNILTDKILKTAIFEGKGVDFTPEPVDMNQLIEQVINSMKLVFDKHKAAVAFQKQGQDFHLLGGPVHLTSVIYNLIDNAIKYSPVSTEIMISLTDEGDEVVIKVQDKGIGIAPEFRKKVFEKFFRVPTGDIHNIKGYGLGLSYVESVVKSHHGSIAVDSAPGSGSVFTIRLPKKIR